ncbi:hypothetical protein A9G34_00560 [Gilliamella sp. Choc4-2]|jgi:undecaprenyl-diphosphatase|uniref:phosphatase PAP2 family protein n=1 Tax=unclassified Gilliamella TaxID=2685620 RepID=UPI0004DCF13F|nr:phosphatase PAP2 family protein [Gilliamella apicola]KFA59341.1 putative permease [Gilliamella apicola]OCG32625.1 hypothetical protein A9G33_03310 [Gilliamella apicola]OCG46391.1 hypothetical protein A9G34_00560 [Gilliamella apicola]OCG53745.1 hypothetical protein A9G36_09540 [Gilliamella apicola]OCG64289.1 hypothetical protein A9G48_03385 [Gilliamella apicola]
MWRNINIQLFLLINASEHASKIFINFAIFCASYLIYFPIIILGVYWLIKPISRQLIIKIIIGLMLALWITFVIRYLFYSPRPFEMEIGTNYLHHGKNSSLPSQHAVFVWTISLTILFNYKQQFRALLYLCVGVALLVCWSRVYLGIHWPLDIIIGFIVSILSAYFVRKC